MQLFSQAVVIATIVYVHNQYTSLGTKFHALYKTKGQFIVPCILV